MSTGEKNSGPTFSAYILLSEGIQFNTNEIAQALAEDYPTLEISGHTNDVLAFDCNTDEFITSPMLMGSRGDDARSVSLIRLPGYGTWDPARIPLRQSLLCPDISDRLKRNRSYICVSVGADDSSLKSTFRAARLCSCVAAIFAKLPVALAAYWETGDHFLSPEAVVKMADEAVCDKWPVSEWVGLDLARGQTDGQPMAGGLTVGLKAFRNVEISHAGAPIEIAEAAQMMLSVATMCLEYGRKYGDGDTIGREGQSREQSYRVRVVPKGTRNSNCDVYLIVHPQSTVDHEALAGPIETRPPPPGVDNSIPPNEGFFKSLMRGGRSH